MTEKLHISVSPHIHTGQTVHSIMLNVVIALAPAIIAGNIIFGWRAIGIVAICIVSCVLSEYLFNVIAKKKQSIGDFSAVVTGVLLALNLPVNVPVWQAVIGSVFAIIVVKCFFGGMGCNLVNPAIAARVFMILSFDSVIKVSQPIGVDSVSSATPLVDIKNGITPDLMTLLMGRYGGTIGETCALAIIIGGLYLIITGIITWHIPVAYIGSVFVLSFLVNGFDLYLALAGILSGGLMIGAFFMATDYVTSPATPKGKIVFGVIAGIVTVLIRFWGVYPEGVSFAILFANILNPYIDVWTARQIFGGKSHG